MAPELEIGAKKFSRTCQDDEGDTEHNLGGELGKLSLSSKEREAWFLFSTQQSHANLQNSLPTYIPPQCYWLLLHSCLSESIHCRVGFEIIILTVQHFQHNTKFQTYLRSIQVQVRSSMAWNPVSQSQLKADQPPLTPEALIELLGARWRFLPSPQKPRMRGSLLWASAKQHHYQNITGDVCID